MAVLETIRTKLGLAASIIIAIGLLSFIVDPSSLQSAMQSMSSKFDVGNINGKSVSYTDFQDEVNRMTTINELMTGSSSQSAEQQVQARDAAWQNLVYKNLFVKEARAAGINVGEEEMVDLTTGSNLSPLVSQNPVFMDENGTFSKTQLLSLIQNLDADATGNLRLYWNYLQESILNQQYFDKYSSLFTNSVNANPLMLRKAVEENNTTADVEFVMIPLGYEDDSTIVVSDNEIKEYYNNHKNFFKQQASRDIEYVVYEVTPSAKDIEETKTEITELYEEFASAENMKSFLLKNSDRPYSEYWFKKGELTSFSSELDNFVWEGKTEVSEVISANDNFYMARVMDSKMVPDSAFVKHILLQGTTADQVADSLLTVLKKGENFSNVAALHSADQGSAANGEIGSIGWMTQSYLIPGFEGVFLAKKGEPFIIKTQYGTHIVLVSDKTAPVAKKQVAILEKEILASRETFADYYNKANQFATAAAGSYENYRKAVDTLGVYSHPVNGMPEGADRLGAIENTKEVTRWAFDNKEGKVSNIITVDNNYFIITTVKGIHEEGYATLDEVSSVIKETLYAEKLAANKKAEVAKKIEGLNDLNAIAEKLGYSVSTQSGVAFSSLTQSLDPALVGAIASAQENVISGPVAGTIGIYVFKVTARETGSFFTEEDAKARMMQENAYMTQSIIPIMMQDADVKDNRARFF